MGSGVAGVWVTDPVSVDGCGAGQDGAVSDPSGTSPYPGEAAMPEVGVVPLPPEPVADDQVPPDPAGWGEVPLRAVDGSSTRPPTRGTRPRSWGTSGSSRAAEPSGFDRQPPQDLTAEQSVLGGMLLSKDAIADVVEVLRPEDFYRPAHQTVYETILDLYGRGEPADAVTVSAELQRRGELVRLGGAPYLHTLIATVPTAANAAYYAEIVGEKAILRRLVEAGTRIVQLGYHGNESGEVEEVVDRAQAAVYEVTDRTTTEDYTVLEELLQPTMDAIDAIGSQGGAAAGVPTGFTDLDRVTNGLHPGQMVVVAARPGLGKSTLGLDFARSCSIGHGMTSAFFSLEMSKSEIVMRLLSAEARIRLADMRAGRMSEDDWTRMACRMSEISEAPLFIDDSPNLTLMEIRAKARRLKQRHDLKLIILDYLQLMTSGRKVESRQQEVSEFSRQIKLLAKELEVPVVAMSQLNRGPEQRTDKRPMLSDLRESGSIEQDADMVILLHRPDAFENDDPRAGEADLILAKHRNGPTVTVTVAHQLHYSRFVSLGAEDPFQQRPPAASIRPAGPRTLRSHL
ncbi:Replicative DNA helicase [Pseudonocardia sp. Ae406_Ps2]|nr:Replicative DNA helicase [Pseudonocardia sp. Ae331_Ps2]OLL90014.1 Replicative DNA helicase [Pseudonocardia sp. Ae406_Ps2]